MTPKANILERDGSIWIAKFPSYEDVYDVAAWEKLLHDLATACSLQVPESKLIRIGNGYHTFLVKRFDRTPGSRIFFSSAMAMLGRQDSSDASYLELAEFITRMGNPEKIERDLKELFKRVVFNVVTANRDDHLRNHGFMRSPEGWCLAPAFDLNPSFKKDEHVLALDTGIRSPDLTVVVETAQFYRITAEEAKSIIAEICSQVAKWGSVAKRLGFSATERAEASHLFIDAPPW